MILTLLVTHMLNGVYVTHERYGDLAAFLTWMKRTLYRDLNHGDVPHRLASGRGVTPRVRWGSLVTESKTSAVNLTRKWRAMLSDLTTPAVRGTRVNPVDGLNAQSLARHIAMSRYDIVEVGLMERKFDWSCGSIFGLNVSRG